METFAHLILRLRAQSVPARTRVRRRAGGGASGVESAEATARRLGCPPGERPPGGEPLRPEIQALRAIAVALVVVCHTWPGSLSGGFVGVDVFFAISGFLITSHLLREADRRGTISLWGFWARRARRILPAALTVLLCCALATVALTPLTHWDQHLGEIEASTAYVQNWHLAERAVDYFAADDGPSPVTHFWSLSAEEQFYLVWPVVIFAALWAARGFGPRGRRRAIGGALGTIAAASLAFSLHETATNPAQAYFVTPARAWEFALGGLLALAGGSDRLPSSLRSGLSWIGIGAIAVAAAAYSKELPFPGSAAGLPVLGALAVMWAGAPRSRLAPTPLLSLRPVQFIGDLSYSVYLWHWPLLVFAPFALGRPVSAATGGLIVAVTLVAAWITKVAIEDPIRTRGFLVGRRAPWTFAAMALGSALVLGVTAGAGARVGDQLRAEADQSRRVLASQPACFGAAARDPSRPCRNRDLRLKVVPTPLEAAEQGNAPCEIQRYKRLCAFGVPAAGAKSTFALVGDSHASHWRASLEAVARARGWRGLSITRSGCPFSRATKELDEPDRSECRAWNREMMRWLHRHSEVETVVVSQISGGKGFVAARGRGRFETAVSGYRDAWKALPKSVRRVIVIRDTPKAATGTADCVARAMRRRRPAGPACALARDEVLDRDPAAVAAQRMRSRRVRMIDMTRFFCGARRCLPVVGGALVFKDQHHITAVYGATLGPYLDRAIERALRS